MKGNESHAFSNRSARAQRISRSQFCVLQQERTKPKSASVDGLQPGPGNSTGWRSDGRTGSADDTRTEPADGTASSTGAASASTTDCGSGGHKYCRAYWKHH